MRVCPFESLRPPLFGFMRNDGCTALQETNKFLAIFPFSGKKLENVCVNFYQPFWAINTEF